MNQNVYIRCYNTGASQSRMESTRDHTMAATTTPSQVDSGEQRTIRIKPGSQHAGRHAFVSRMAACAMLSSVAHALVRNLCDIQKLFWRFNLVRSGLLLGTIAPTTATTSTNAAKTTTTTTTTAPVERQRRRCKLVFTSTFYQYEY